MNESLLPARRPRGEPLLVLALIVGGWLMMRVMLWQSPFDRPVAILASAARAAMSEAINRPVRDARQSEPAASPVPGSADAPATAPLPAPWLTARTPVSPLSSIEAFERRPARQIVGQQLLLAAAFAHMELPPEIAAYFVAPGGGASLAPELATSAPSPPGKAAIRPMTVAGRWSGDAWLMLRNGSSGPIAVGGPSYGRSQAGTVLRYRLAPSNGHRPLAYVRTTRALAGPREDEIATGLSARPIAGLPLRVAGEVRVSEGSAGRELRPAAFAVTELPPAKLPLGLRAEAYAQAGYVGGRYATAFIDGQARIDGRITRLGAAAEVRAGAGVWGGAQSHAERLDIGPSATVNFRLGAARSRVALDYRVRVAGDAAPQSGPALTISAGF